MEKLLEAQIQVLWQTGKGYYDAYKARLKNYDLRRIRVQDFLREMDLAYAAADVVISRSGALSVSEICVAKKPVILVPSPNVAEDHQTKNAMALAEKNAAIVVTDKDANEKLVDTALSLIFDASRASKLRENIAALAKPYATRDIVNEIELLLKGQFPKGQQEVYSIPADKKNSGTDRERLQPIVVKSRNTD
jgi:UDP-N-acetylglucosamine--N-acetylmuramyl-(pentapeptide) pyrophosphoryl-undecaprenol N-acetylglucosamine transferase